jgi:alpha-galactosidase
MLNRGTVTKDITLHWTELGYHASLNAEVHDLWQAKNMGRSKESYTAQVASHGVVILTMKP